VKARRKVNEYTWLVKPEKADGEIRGKGVKIWFPEDRDGKNEIISYCPSRIKCLSLKNYISTIIKDKLTKL
jgi:hypothetical protein